jgi:hypothetical protein
MKEKSNENNHIERRFHENSSLLGKGRPTEHIKGFYKVSRGFAAKDMVKILQLKHPYSSIPASLL